MLPNKVTFLSTVVMACMLTSCVDTTQMKSDMQGFSNGIGSLLGNSQVTQQFIASACTTAYCAQTLSLLGENIVKQMNQQDMQLHSGAIERAVSSGRAQNWSNGKSGNSGQVQVTRAASRSSEESINVLKGQIEEVPPLDAIGEVYVASSTVNLRGGPGTEYQVMDKLSAGQGVKVFGKVKGKDWYLVGVDDTASGYVTTGVLRKPGRQVKAAPLSPKLKAVGSQRKTVKVALECRQTKVDVKLANGQKGKGNATYCNGPNGWEEV